MSQTPTTRLSLVQRLGDPNDHVAWARFFELYVPVLYGYFRKRGLQDADAADLTQAVAQVVLQRVESFSHVGARGAFRGWLFSIARNQFRKFSERQSRHAEKTGASAITDLADEIAGADEQDLVWEQEYRRHLFAWASDRVRPCVDPSTWQAFWQTAVEGKSGEAVGKALGMSPGAVYMAKSRVMARLRKTIEETEKLEDG
jgi:RNA polymerase sigma-70 factor (ECF subfamily)